MYISAGAGRYIRKDKIIGVFDLDITSQSHITKKYLTYNEKQGKVINATEDIPKSFVVDTEGIIYLSQPSPATLIKRIEENN